MKYWDHMTREELQEAVNDDCVVVVTVGATEQHGPHLPVSVDNTIARTIAEVSVKKAQEHIPIVLGPHIPFGYSPHHFQYAGVISLSIETMISVIEDVLESVLKSGFTKVFLINSHGGNGDLIRVAVKSLHEKYSNCSLGAASYWELAEQSLRSFKNETSLYDVGHAGQFETSLMMAMEPDHVRLSKLALARIDRKTDELLFSSFVQLTSQDIWGQMDGFSDHPEQATKEIGTQLIDIISHDVSEVLRKFHRI